jgi:hypothetical protein
MLRRGDRALCGDSSVELDDTVTGRRQRVAALFDQHLRLLDLRTQQTHRLGGR